MTTFGIDGVEIELQRVLTALALDDAQLPTVIRETKHVDLKEEPGRRVGPAIQPPSPQNEVAARGLAEEAACMSNTSGGGALIVGVANNGVLIGTGLDAEWLRRRMYDVAEKRLTVDVRPVDVRGHRLLVLRCPEAIEPIRANGRITWRVDDSCVDIDPTTWHARRLSRVGFDWSAQSSGLPFSAARATAIERAREFLRDSAETSAVDLAGASDIDVLTRLNVVTPSGELTNAGVVAFVGREVPALDYIRREGAGTDSVNRIRRGGRGVIEELYDVEQAIRAVNPILHVPTGFVAGQLRQLPPGAVRETIVNGCVHRDWNSAEPTLVEHMGGTLVVTSPGGFIGGVTSDNIITHPSQPRNPSLAELFARLRVAEREGVGVDRMVREMIRAGHQPPTIEEVAGPHVRAALVGELVDPGWMQFLSELAPARHRSDLNSLLLLRQLVDNWWVDADIAARVLQRSPDEAAAALLSLGRATVRGRPVIEEVIGIPADSPTAWHLSVQAIQALDAADGGFGRARRHPTRPQVAMAWARTRGRVSTTELGSIVGASPTNLGSVLKGLERDGLLEPGREVRRGPGFYYRPTD